MINKTSIQLFKVIASNGTGGYSDFVWPLPSATKPGKWVSVKGKLAFCENGLHATTDYKKWWKRGGRIFLFEPRGSFLIDSCESKICCRSGRLVREITLADLLIKMDKTLMAWVMLGIFQREENVDIFVGADLRGANLHCANLRGADLHKANLRDADLHEANLHGADLHEANLRGANLRRANLRDANLHEANLRDANLYEANLHGANLRGANLHGANLRGAYRPENDLDKYK